MHKSLPVPAIGTFIKLNHASVQKLKSKDYGVRIRFNMNADAWQMLDSPQNGGKHGGFIVVLDNPNALTDGSAPTHVEILRLLPNSTGAFGRLTHDRKRDKSKAVARTAELHTGPRVSADALFQAAYDREQEARKHAETFGANPAYSQQARRRSHAGDAGSFRKKTSARAA